jgi:nitrite reductase (cytochrome c-552)
MKNSYKNYIKVGVHKASAQAGVTVPVKVNLELAKYLNDRGAGKLKFRKELEFPDPSGIQNRF